MAFKNGNQLIAGWPILLLLYFNRSVNTHIELQKKLFLSFAKEKAIIPYNFKRNDYGPYDKTIKVDSLFLDSQKLIDVTIFIDPKTTMTKRMTFKINERGDRYVEETLLDACGKQAKKIKNIVKFCEGKSWQEIVKLVYEDYDKDKEILKVKIPEMAIRIDKLFSIWNRFYTLNKTPELFLTAGFIDYLKILLEKTHKSENKLDKTQFNVIIKSCADSINYLETHTEQNESAFPEISELFSFLQYTSSNYDILPALDEEDATLEDFSMEGDDIRQKIPIPQMS